MGLRINHNTSAINAHRNLQMNDAQLSKSLEKLASGLEVNRASDGPAALVISEQMRAQIAGLDQAVNNSETAISMVQTAEGALNETNKLLVSMRQLAIHAANEGANDDVMLQADQQEILNSLESIDRISKNTQFGTKKLLDGSNGANGTATGEGLEFVNATTATKSSEGSGFEVRLTQVATQSFLEGSEALTQEMVTAGETFTVVEGGKSATYTTTDQDNVETSVQNLSAAVHRAGLDVKVELTENNTIMVKHNEFGSKHSFQVASTTGGVLSEEGGMVRQATAGQDIAGTINGESAVGDGQELTGITGAKNVEGLTLRYNGPVGQNGEELPEEGTVVGYGQVTQNSLTFQVGANRNQTVGISLMNTSADTMAKGIQNDSGFERLAEIDVTNTQGAQDAILMIDKAINEVSSSRAELGAFQKNTLESNLSNLRIASENLVAAESSIRDADMASEMAQFTRNQVMTQSATAMLAQANQIPGSVLSLLGN